MAAKLFALFDDIVTVLDDVAVLSKMATKKTAGVLGDDLALNANQVSGVSTNRELPVVWAVFKGSFLNKVILVPLALLISAFAPWLIVPLLMVGGTYLCFEGFEKVWHKLFHKAEIEKEKEEVIKAFRDSKTNLLEFEKEKIKGAIKTDFILSAEIIAIILGVVANSSFVTQVGVLCLTAVLMTVSVYGLVALIVKMDDIAIKIKGFDTAFTDGIANSILIFMPYFMKALTVLGTAAMFLVGGGIIAHGVGFLHHIGESLGVWSFVWDGLVGVVVGGMAVAIFNLFNRVKEMLSSGRSYV